MQMNDLYYIELLDLDNNLYIYKQDLALNYPKGLICHKTTKSQPNVNFLGDIIVYIYIYIYIMLCL